MRLHHVLGIALLTVSGAFSPQATTQAAFIYASGQFLIENDPGTHDDVRENRIFRIDPSTGTVTPASPLFTGSTPPALGGTKSGDLLGIRSGRLGKVDIGAGTFSAFGSPLGVTTTAFDILADGRGFVLPFNAESETQQLFSIDLTTASLTSIGNSNTIGNAIDQARGTAAGTAEPFLISLGSVGNVLYGVDLDTYSLISIDSATGAASVVGAVGAVGQANGGGYTGFAGLTGVDIDADGVFDSLYGAVNFGPSGERLGGIAKFDLTNGGWSLVATNPGLIYFGFGSSPVPEPSSIVGISIGLLVMAAKFGRARRRSILLNRDKGTS